MLWRIARFSPFGDRPYASIAALLNFAEPGAVLLPLLGRRSRTSLPKSSKEFIHLGPRQIYRIRVVRGGIEILGLSHDDHSTRGGSSDSGQPQSSDNAGPASKPARHRIRVTAVSNPFETRISLLSQLPLSSFPRPERVLRRLGAFADDLSPLDAALISTAVSSGCPSLGIGRGPGRRPSV